MDALSALRLQLEWGADEALGDAPVDQFAAAPARKAPSLARHRGPERPAVVRAPTADSLDALHAELAASDVCALRSMATHTVRPDGNPQAAIVLIGDAPGSDDDRTGRAFSGRSGEMLDRVLRSIGLDRSQVLLTTLVPWRPPGNRPLSESEIASCLPFVHRLLALVRPQRLVLLGALPVRALTGNTETLRRVRGRWLDVQLPAQQLTIPALPMPPLDQWLRSAAARQGVWSDLIHLRRALTLTST